MTTSSVTEAVSPSPWDELVALGMDGDGPQHDYASQLVGQIAQSGDQRFTAKAAAALDAATPWERMAAAWVLRNCKDAGRNEMRSKVLIRIAEETNADVLSYLLVALGFLGNERDTALVLQFKTSQLADIRLAVVHALRALSAGSLEPVIARAFSDLAADEDPDIRDWAMFGLTQSEPPYPSEVERVFGQILTNGRAYYTDDEDTFDAALWGMVRQIRSKRLLEAGSSINGLPSAFSDELRELLVSDYLDIYGDRQEVLDVLSFIS